MQISWHGQYTIKITSKEDVLIIDPYSPENGLSPFRSKATIVALSNPQDKSMSHTSGVQGDFLLINTPGEYAVRGFTLHGLGWTPTEENNQTEHSLQLWGIEGMSILHVGALNRDLTDQELQQLERIGVDVMLLPVGGGSGLNLKQAMNLLTTIEPRLVIPIHYKLPGLSEKLDGVEQFAKELGVSPTASEQKLLLKANKLPEEEMQTVILKP